MGSITLVRRIFIGLFVGHCALLTATLSAESQDVSSSTDALKTMGNIQVDPPGPLETSIDLQEVQSGAVWGLDVLDGSVDGYFQIPIGANGSGVDVYIVDTGVYASHPEFGGRVETGPDFSNQTGSCDPSVMDGHGTHVAGTIGSTTYGVAKQVRLIDVRILDCDGNGDTDTAARALRWVVRHHKASRIGIVNMSIGAEAGTDTIPMEKAVRALLKDGLIPVVAAGNEYGAACDSSPADVSQALTVSAVRRTSGGLARPSFANYGSCVDLFAPGVAIRSTWNNTLGLGWVTNSDGTSMATPHVSGLAALIAQAYPDACARAVRNTVVQTAATDMSITNLLGSPQRMVRLNLNVAPAISRPGQVTQVVPGVVRSGRVRVGWDAPCNGGSPVTSSTIRVYKNGTFEKSVTITGSKNTTQIGGLTDGESYTFDVYSSNALGDGLVSPRSFDVIPGPLFLGSSNGRSVLDLLGVAAGSGIQVDAASTEICEIVPGSPRLVQGLEEGICTLIIRPKDAGYLIARQIVIENT